MKFIATLLIALCLIASAFSASVTLTGCNESSSSCSQDFPVNQCTAYDICGTNTVNINWLKISAIASDKTYTVALYLDEDCSTPPVSETLTCGECTDGTNFIAECPSSGSATSVVAGSFAVFMGLAGSLLL
ncbi:hypothetical protein DFA_00136 [Cavenderia fasciculata]|uniref:Transmembrane protein n=1 Tax=Cavenderia fasciculata TaxID=261658 RepID=F4PXP8_CACFS|nr:uncharacterized protein DFA_00136 [Cavenderia fasciculata]EGG19558.1 hypothetical protein DFA_00136 [Cavenderia fasciculata]|eukprot:XP_004357852.1 hypothetical protein DFA_00136 [Cavenderia fasciculata]